jgi:hypothetical protein
VAPTPLSALAEAAAAAATGLPLAQGGAAGGENRRPARGLETGLRSGASQCYTEAPRARAGPGARNRPVVVSFLRSIGYFLIHAGLKT